MSEPDRSCATCQHWKGGPSYGTCERVTDESDGAYIVADLYEDWAMKADPAQLRTAHDFGCTLWQPTTEENSP